jgi:hypothetical protein
VIIEKARTLPHLVASPSKRGRHRNDPHQHRLPAHLLGSSRHLAGFRRSRIDPHADAEPRAIATKRCRSALVPLSFPSAMFNGIDGGVKQSVSRMAIEASRTLGCGVRQSHVTDQNPISIALLMPVWPRFSDDDYDNDNDNDNDNERVRCPTCFGSLL